MLHIRNIYLLWGSLLLPILVFGQVRISGTVFDMSMKQPLEAVSVLSNSGKGTFTGANGKYTIILQDNDSIWFSYLNRPTAKFSVTSIINRTSFEIALHINTTELKEVQIKPRNYRVDSLQNRLDYAKAFDFTKPGISSSISPSGGVGLDINEFINMFRFRRNRRMLAFQERLMQEEADRFIDHRFSKPLIRKLTGLAGKELDSFVVRYRPDIDFTQSSNEYEFQEYIKLSFQHFRKFERLREKVYKTE